MCHPTVLARFACIDLFSFFVRTTYIDLRHAGAHMRIWYARWALVWYNLGRSSPFFRRDRNDHDVLPLHIALDNEAPT